MKNYVSAAILALGITLAGVFVYLGVHQVAMKDRSVIAKGLSTRDVKADHVVWPLMFSVEGNDLNDLHLRMAKANKIITDFLLSKGFESTDLTIGRISIDDHWIYNYSDSRPTNRYSINSTIIVSTNKVDKVLANQGCQVELLSKGLVVNVNEWEVNYEFNGLNELKPIMVEEATVNARAVAQKFADDADCKLGSIKKASQGQFSIESDSYQPWMKHVRVVTTIDYYLN